MVLHGIVNRQRKWHSFGTEITGHLNGIHRLSSTSYNDYNNTEEVMYYSASFGRYLESAI